MADTKKQMMEWLGTNGNPMNTKGSQVIAETTGETFDAHSTDAGKHLTVTEKAALKHIKQIRVAPTIVERDAILEPFEGLSVFVKDATGDSSVTSGGAYYIYDGSAWLKTAESESMDVVLNWTNIEGKPLTDAELADLNAKKHVHANAASLDKLTVDAEGLKVDGVGVGGIAILASPSDTPMFNGKLRLVVTEYTAPTV